MAVPSTKHYREALNKGDTLGRLRPCIHWVRQSSFIEEMKPKAHVLGVELAEGATPLALLGPARQRTVVVLGHEHRGIPEEWWDDLDEVVEIPMIGVGGSLNVAVAGSLVLYRLAGLG
jgi:tRNA (guanosine-2'-O-)-methyltransferase